MTKATEAGMKIIRDRFGDEAVIRMGDQVSKKIDVIPTGVLGIDMALGVGGIPRGRVTEIFGPPSSGKTSLSLHIIAEAQKMGLACAFIDAENSLDASYSNALSVNVDDLFVSQPDSGEQGLSIAEIWMMTGDIGLVVVDSVDALVPQDTINGEFGNQLPGRHARMMSQAMRKLSGITRKSNTALLFINQIRKNIMNSYGPSEFTPGGAALIFYSSVRIDVRRIAALKDNSSDENQFGNRTKLKVVKNKVAPPFKEVEFDIVFGRGIDKVADLLDIGLSEKIIDRAGSWYSYESTRLGQGRPAALATLTENTEMLEAIKASILKAKGME